MISLKALELFGFKSFADRTRFEFPAGVTAVVGPNGSGKSNVVDAIKWVLGEQSVRSLRGKEMTDVIFAGSAGRKPLNMAEVALVFDNSTRELPLPTDDVQIMRRVYRSGESEYLVNGETSRLKDIRQLFSGTGAATEAYSVIEQGRVDALLVASGRDRRIVFEEAAGITRFRTRRTEALRRLERAEQNRQRLADIVGEVAARLETVRNQAARARRWRNLTDRLRIMRIAAARQDLAGADADVAAVEAALTADRGALQAADDQRARVGRQLTDLTAAFEACQPALAASRADAAATAQRAAAAAATLELQRSRAVELDAEIQRATAALSQAVAASRQATRDAEAARATADAMQASLGAIEAELADCERAADGTRDDATTAHASLAAAIATGHDLRDRAVRLDAAAEAAAARAAAIAEAVTAARDALAVAQSRRIRLDEAKAAAEGHLASLDMRLATATRDLQAADAAHRGMASRIQEAWRTLADHRAAAEACRERRDVLGELIARQEGLSDAARQLLDDRAASVPGLLGPLADRIMAPVEYAALVDIALGKLGSALLVERLDDAIAWYGADSVREPAGRIGFVSLDSHAEPSAFDPEPVAGLVGRLDRLLDASRSAEPSAAAESPAETSTPPDPGSDPNAMLARRLLGHAWLVDRIEQAVPLVASAPAGTLFIDRDGACLSGTGGFEAGQGSGFAGQITRRSELRALEIRARELAEEVDRATAQVATLETELEQLTQEVQAARGRRQREADALLAARGELDRVSRDERVADEAIVTAEAALHEAERRAVDAEAAERATLADRDAARQAVRDSEREIAARRSAIATLEQSRGQAIETVQRLRVAQATCREKLDHARNIAASMAAAAGRLQDDLAVAEAARGIATERRLIWERQVLAAGAILAETAWTAESTAAGLARLEAEAAAREARRRELERELDQARSTAASLAERIHARELEAGDARHHRVRIVERIRDEYDLDIEAIEPDDPAADGDEPLPTDRGELDRLIEDHRRKVAGMGHVNLEALTEADELSTRLATLEAQLADVTSGRESIEQLIARIDEESRRLLGETIETVRGHFRELFERVFGGGQADLVLEPGVDLLETSVEILARPPGKEPRNISLLSGGEKTMTCVALLLAIFRSSPSPFCVLDEVDAALDEANVDRFVGVLRDFMSATQFIVVTHSKKTMAAAGTLYGVTMEESGVSKRMAVRFESAAATAAVSVSRAA